MNRKISDNFKIDDSELVKIINRIIGKPFKPKRELKFPKPEKTKLVWYNSEWFRKWLELARNR